MAEEPGRLHRALFDFKGEDGQLKFIAGDVINVKRIKDGEPWGLGEINGITGWFPIGYVDFSTEIMGSPIESKKIIVPPTPAMSYADFAPAETQEIVRAAFDYVSRAGDEISFKAGDMITVKSKNGDWWKGSVNGMGSNSTTGLFPSNYVETVPKQVTDAPKLSRVQMLAQGYSVKSDSSASKPLNAVHHRPPLPTIQQVPPPQSKHVHVPLRSSERSLPPPIPVTSSVQYPEELISISQPVVGDLSIQEQSPLNTQLMNIGKRKSSISSSGSSKPLWRYWAFTDIMADAYLKCRHNPNPDTTALAASFQFLSRAIGNVSADTNSNVHRAMHSVLRDAALLTETFPIGSSSEEHFLFYLNKWVDRVKQLREEEYTMGPGGWIRDDGTGNLVVFLVKRESVRADKKDDTYSLSVVNSYGEGTKYHASRPDPTTGNVLQLSVLSFTDIPVSRLRDASFWFFALRPLVFPSVSNGPELLYERLLPYLNSRPLYSNISASIIKNDTSEFLRPPYGGNPSKCHTVLSAIKHAFRLSGLTAAQGQFCDVLLRLAIIQMMKVDLDAAVKLGVNLRGIDSIPIHLACRELARMASDAQKKLNPDSDVRHLTDVQATILGIKESVEEIRVKFSTVLPPGFELSSNRIAHSGAHPLFGRLRRDASVEHLAGKTAVPPIVRPVELTSVPDRFELVSFEDVGIAMQKAVHVCTLLSNQSNVIKNTYLLRVSLLVHFFTRVIPLPMPCGHEDTPKRCFWQGENRLLRYETQCHIMNQLGILCRHFVSASLSLKVTRSFDAVRMLTMACIATIADVVLRKKACDTPSICSLHYSGDATGPVYPFGFSMGYFEGESEWIKLPDPAYQAVRCQVLDYFAYQTKILRYDHILFEFETSTNFGAAESQFITQICLHMGYPLDEPFKLLIGENSLLVDNYPELGIFRDIVYLLKAIMAPSSDDLPEVYAWMPQDAKLSWKWAGPNKGCIVKGFGDKVLRCSGFVSMENSDFVGGDQSEPANRKASAENKNVLVKLAQLMNIGVKKTRAPPSGANPSTLVNKTIETEDDVLFVQNLPDFDDRLRARDSELLLQYLTVPYMRIPLVVQFLADPVKMQALWSEDLQEVLDAVLFEPATWQTLDMANSPAYTHIPAPNRNHLSTPCGLLFNELLWSPTVLLNSLDKMLDTALELDAGKYTKQQSPIILYILRLCVRVEAFILYLDDDIKCDATRGLEEHNRRPETMEILRAAQKLMRLKLNKVAFPMLERWLARLVKHNDTEGACLMHAHLLYLFKNINYSDINYTIASVIVTAQVWLTVHYRFDLEATERKPKKHKHRSKKKGQKPINIDTLQIPSTEIFDILAQHRNKLLKWLRNHDTSSLGPTELIKRGGLDDVMEGVIRIITLTGDRHSAKGEDTSFVNMQWTTMLRSDCIGRFIPDVGLVKKQWEEENNGSRFYQMTYEDWLRSKTQAVDVEINIQLGEFTLKRHAMTVLPSQIEKHPDFVTVFGTSMVSNVHTTVGCAEVHNSEHRQWLRLVGRRHDIQYWDADPRQVICPYKRPYNRQGGPPGDPEAWIAQVLEPIRLKYFPQLQLFLPDQRLDQNENVALLAALHRKSILISDINNDFESSDSELDEVQVEITKGKDSRSKLSTIDTNQADGSTETSLVVQLKEFVVLRDLHVVHVYNVVSHGRRFYRTLVFSSNTMQCLHHIAPCGVVDSSDEESHLVGGDALVVFPAKPSLVITRNLYASVGMQYHIPSRLVYGTIPSCLLEQYDLWQNEDDSLTGIPKYANKARHRQKISILTKNLQVENEDVLESLFAAAGTQQAGMSVLRIRLKKHGDSDSTGMGISSALGKIERIVYPHLPLPKDLGGNNAAEKMEGILRGISEEKEISPAKHGKMQRYYKKDSLRCLNGEENDGLEVNTNGQICTLLNLMYAPTGSPLQQLASLLTRLESPSHILVWSKGQVINHNEGGSINLVELPRLRLTFTARPSPVDAIQNKAKMLLYSQEHNGMFLSSRRTSRLEGLLSCLPNSVLLENDDGELFVLVAAASMPARPELSDMPFSSDVLFNRGEPRWLKSLGSDVRHYVYPVHTSESMLGTPSLASALYLLLMRLMGRDYSSAFRMVESCITDMKLTAEESLIFGWIGSLKNDHHPDAVACRLKISKMTGSCEDMGAQCPWDLSEQVELYSSRLEFVSAACRLAVEEELDLIRRVISNGNPGPATKMREEVLQLITSCSPNAKEVTIPVTMPALHPVKNYDGFIDNTCLEEAEKKENIFDKMKVAIVGAYMPPPDVQGVTAIQAINAWVQPEDVASVAGQFNLDEGKYHLGFPFFYCLMTGVCSIRLLPDDSSFNWASVFLRLLPWKIVTRKDLLMSILKALSNNPSIATDAPRLMPKMPSDRLMRLAHQHLNSKRNLIRWPLSQSQLTYHSPKTITLSPLLVLQQQDRAWFSLRVPDLACSSKSVTAFTSGSVTFTSRDVSDLCSIPLSSLGVDKFVVFKTRKERGIPPISPSLPFSVESHSSSNAHVSQTMLERLKEDVQWFSEHENNKTVPELVGFSEKEIGAYLNQPRHAKAAVTRLEGLLQSLRALASQDYKWIKSAYDRLIYLASFTLLYEENKSLTAPMPVDICNALSFSLSQMCGLDYIVSLEDLIQLLLCFHGEGILSYINPYLSKINSSGKTVASEILDLLVAYMLKTSRLAQLMRCCSMLRSLIKALNDVMDGTEWEEESAYQGLIRKSETLASSLVARRNYVIRDSSGIPHLDVRLLQMEFSLGILLHAGQVELIGLFMSNAVTGKSVCHQMIMGAGKTTVVAPTLALLLAQGDRLIMEVVPDALLDFAFGIMRSTFSIGLQKTVYTFRFDRFMDVTVSLLHKLEESKRTRSIIVTTPTSIKAFMLKFVELLDRLESCRLQKEERDEDGLGKNKIEQGFRKKFGLRKVWSARSEVLQDIKDLTQQAEIAVEILKIFRNGALLLDEVDLILHPLKSELNWPLGKKRPLDMTRARPGSNLGDGLRWQIPFHLLDALFYCNEGRSVIDVAFRDSRRAKSILESIKEMISRGCDLKVVQRTPHIVLLSKAYYKSKIKPLLAQWVLLWMRQKGLRDLKDEVIAEYLLEGPDKSSILVQQRVKESLSDDNLRMLNLTHNWLKSFMPHILSKIDRVSFGLLTPGDLERALANDPSMPRSRKLLAVPFVGKDVPSRASEFSHPDIVIGMTILAYRYEGLRSTDFLSVMRGLRASMEDEHGPYLERPSCKAFVQWVTLAGGSVRGVGQKGLRALQAIAVTPLTAPPADLLTGSTVTLGLDNDPSDSNDEYHDLWPLQLLDLKDDDMMGILFKLLRHVPQVIEYYLDCYIFPETMEYQPSKLAANGQDVGGDMLFKSKLGFSGTPSDLLPVELGRCQFEKGNTAMMLHYLTDPKVAFYHLLPSDWTVKSMLDTIANSIDPKFNALIDVGAIITGLSNLEVAQYLLTNGLPDMDGVVYLDSKDRKMIITRSGGLRPMLLSQCHVSPHLRFSFYDQVHTTGMDIKQALNCTAAVTLGKDMTFRDYAQGSFRMRGIGKGQRIQVLIVPEVYQLINREVASGLGTTISARLSLLNSLPPAERHKQVLCDISAWLTINSMKSEKLQWNLLMEQQAQNVWRKRAYSFMQAGFSKFGQPAISNSDSQSTLLLYSLDTFRQRVDHSVENNVPLGVKYSDKITSMVADTANKGLLDDVEDQEIIKKILGLVIEAESSDPNPDNNAQSSADSNRLLKRPSVKSGSAYNLTKSTTIHAEAIYSYSKSADSNSDSIKYLTLVTGDRIEIISQENKDWWIGKLKGVTGWFPASYVKVVEQTGFSYSASSGYEEEDIGNTLSEMAQERAFEAEQVQEKEQEQEQEQEQEEEQEKEEVVMEAQEPDEFIKQKYSRDDETPKPWPIEGLAHLNKHESLGFFRTSEFGVLTKLIQQPKYMQFPEYMYISRNYYDRGWGLKTYRRIKNIIILLDWLVNASTITPVASTKLDRKVTPEQELRLRKAFNLWDGDGDGRLNQSEFMDLLRGLDVNVDDPVFGQQLVINIAKDTGLNEPTVSFEQVKELMRQQIYAQVESNRSFVALSLSEAESIRGLVHYCSSRNVRLLESNNASIAIRLTNNLLLDGTLDFIPPGSYHLSLAQQCFRFIDSEINYDATEMAMLLRGVQDNDRYLREAWFMDMRACRRRVQGPIANTSLARMISLPDEYHLLDYRSTICAVKRLLKAKQLLARDAFAAFNSSHSGALTCSELYGGLVWLGMRCDPPLIHDIVRTIDLSNDGYVNWEEFKKAFGDSSDDIEDISAVNSWPSFDNFDGEAEGNAHAFFVPPKPMPELYDVYNSARLRDIASAQKVESMGTERLEAFKVKVQRHDRMERIWTTHGSGARSKSSIWAPDVGINKLINRNRIRIILGHFAKPGLNNFTKKDAEIEPLVIEITDTGMHFMGHDEKIDTIVDTIFPRPIRFREIWKQESGDKPCFVWRPVPPSSAYVALGMVATTSEEQPSIECVRCVPKRWTVPVEMQPVKVWDDSGTGGKLGSFWVVNSLHCLHAVAGHDAPPSDDLYDLKNHRFFLSHQEIMDIENASSSSSKFEPGMSTKNISLSSTKNLSIDTRK